MFNFFPTFRLLFRQVFFNQDQKTSLYNGIRKKRKVTLKRREHTLRLFVEHSPAAIAMLDNNMRYLIASKRYLKDYQIECDDIIGKSHYDIFPEIPERWKEIHRRCLSGMVEKEDCDPFVRTNGKTDWVKWEIHPWREDGCKIGGIIIFSEVITERVLVENALKKSEKLFYKAFYNNPSIMIISKLCDDKIIAVNGSFTELMEYSKEEVIGTSKLELNLVERFEWDDIKQALKEKRTLRNLEIQIKTKTGKEKVGLLSVVMAELSGETCVISNILDITYRKIAEMQLKEKNFEIETQNEEYQQLNEELVQINEELEVAKTRAEESDRLKTAFPHNISHEIRTPMNAIVGFISLLKNQDLAENKRVRYCDIVDQSSKQLLSIINDIIDIAAIEAGQIKFSKEEVNLNSVMQFLQEQFQMAAGRKDVSLKYSVSLPDDKAILITDETKLLQILTNLIGNAVKFTSSGSINFGYQLKYPYIEFFVEDTGIGIPPEMQVKIFNRFHQVESSRASSYGGSGLGLSISKGYVELNGGKIWVVSEEGKGSVFYFTHPYTLKTTIEKILS
jgi:PAS domain S-box-containing protein